MATGRVPNYPPPREADPDHQQTTCPSCGQSVLLPAPGVEPGPHNLPGSWREVSPGFWKPRECSWRPPKRTVH